MDKEVLNFIHSFSQYGNDVISCFTCGNCYWFAHILEFRFPGRIMYDVIANHFGCAIGEAVYDITGDVTNQYNWEPWDLLINHYDDLVVHRIIRDCIDHSEKE